jgi:hypothetical protein
MKYMLLIYNAPDAGPTHGSPEWKAQHAQWGEYSQALQAAGVMLSGDPLEGAETATTVRERDGQKLTTDGPFAETKEWLYGYYAVDVADLDAALDWARRMPNIQYGSVEVRPILDFSAM